MGRYLGKYILSKLFFVGWLFATASPLLFLMWLVRNNEKLHSALLWVTTPLVLVCFFGSFWLGSTSAHYMVDENRMFLDSLKRTLYDLRLRLAFIPVLGWWFTPDEDMADLKDDEEPP